MNIITIKRNTGFMLFNHKLDIYINDVKIDTIVNKETKVIEL